MNCCDEFGNCRQGRDCPVRRAEANPKHAHQPVAPVGWRYPYVPVKLRSGPTWRETLRAMAELALIAILCILSTAFALSVLA